MRLSFHTISKIGVLICLVYVMWYKWVYGDHTIVLYSAAAIAILGMVFGLAQTRQSLSLVFPYGCIRDIVMCFYSFVTGVLVATSSDLLISNIITYLAFSLVCLSFCYASYYDGIDWLLKGVVLISLLCAVWTLFKGYYRTGYGMVLSPTNNPHTLSFVMVVGIFAVAYLSQTDIKHFFLNFIVAILFVYVVIQCGSRKGLLAALIILIPWILIEIKTVLEVGSTTQKFLILAVLVVLVLAGSYYYFHSFINTTSFERMANIEESQANKARLLYFELGKEYFLKSPIFGIGIGQFAVLNPDGAYSHSTIPEAFASWGIVGALLYFIPILTVCYRAFYLMKLTRRKEDVMIFALCVMELFMSFLQIFFYSLQHMIVWAIIFIYIESRYNDVVYED